MGRRRWDEPPYGPEAEALTGRASWTTLLAGGGGGACGTSLLIHKRDASLRAEALTGRAPIRSLLTGRRQRLTGPLAGSAYGTPPCGRKRLRDEPPYGPETLTGQASLRAGAGRGGAYGTSLLRGGTQGRATGRRRLHDKPPYEPEGEAYGTEAAGTSLLTGRSGGAYGTSLGSLRDGALITGGAYGTSFYGTTLLTGRRRRRSSLLIHKRLRDEPYYGSETLTGRAALRRRRLTGWRRLRAEALTGRALIRAGVAYGTSLLTGRRRRLTGRASLRDGGAGTSLLTGRRRNRLRDEPRRRGGDAYGTSPTNILRAAEACGTSLLAGHGSAYGTSLLTDGGAYGTSLLTGRAFLRGGTHRARLRDGGS